MSCVDEILAVYIDKGSNAYGGERINQLEHALQTALLAEQAGADGSLIVASLLHDYGHLIHNVGEDVFKSGIDDRHEILGAEKLSAYFGDAVTMPIRMHVEAKRYLCAIDPNYMKNLSPASTWSLEVKAGHSPQPNGTSSSSARSPLKQRSSAAGTSPPKYTGCRPRTSSISGLTWRHA